MTDEELGFEIWKRTNCVEPNVTMHEIMGRAARELLAKPVATREEVAKWVADAQYGKHTLTDLIFAAISLFTPPARPRMMIEGMKYTEIRDAMVDVCAAAGGKLNEHDHLMTQCCAATAHRLATTPAPKVDADDGPREMCNGWAKAQNAKPGPLRDLVPEFDEGDEEWRKRWRDHYAWVLSGFPKPPTWAVAAKKEAGGE